MARESISRSTFVKGIAAGAVVACSLGALTIPEYSTANKGGDYNFTPGTYNATAKGMESDVGVTITVDEHTIQDVKVDVAGETPTIGALIGDEVSGQILTAQSSAIDGVAGATVSSNAVKEALDAAIAKAEKGEDPIDPNSIEDTEAATEGAEGTEGSTEEETDAPGTYTGTAEGMNGDVTAKVTLDGDEITAVKLDVSGETKNIGGKIGDEMAQKFLDAQSAKVDGVAGATVTSDALKAAVADALAQAGIYTGAAEGMNGDVTAKVMLDGDQISSIKLDVSGETKNIGGKIGDEMAQKMLDAQTSDVDGVAGATITSDGAKAAVADALAQAGIFTGAAEGMNGDVTAKVVIDDEKIVSITLDVSGETKNIGGKIGEDMAQKMLDAQSADVDSVAGATITSDAAKAAVKAALAKAFGEEVEVSSEAESETEALAAAGYTAGTYTASAQGKVSEVSVEATFDETALTDVVIDISGETPDVVGDAATTLAQAFIDAQSADVDGVAGATVTSDALKAAMEDVFAQASK